MNEEEIKFLQFENRRLREDLKIANKNWKFENERLQLSINARLQELVTYAQKLSAAEKEIVRLENALKISCGIKI